MSLSYAYKKRAADAGFRASWTEAVAVAFQRLELMLLDRAFNGTEKLVRRRDGAEERMTEYSDRLRLALLKIHRETAAEAEIELPAETVDEIRERLVQKLKRLKARNEQQKKADE